MIQVNIFLVRTLGVPLIFEKLIAIIIDVIIDAIHTKQLMVEYMLFDIAHAFSLL